MFFLYFLSFSYGVFCCPVTCENGHSFCSECITVWQANNSRCPVNRSTLSRQMVRNLAVKGAIGGKVMKCPSTVSLPGGCGWTGTRSSLEDHLPRCDMKVVECPFENKGCILRAYQRELAQHLLVCPHKTVKCSFCSQEIPHNELLAHSDHCAGKLVSCPNECGMQIARYVSVFFVVSLLILYVSFLNCFAYYFTKVQNGVTFGFCVCKRGQTLSTLFCWMH